MSIHILSLSDRVEPALYCLKIRESFPDVDLVLGCGDLPYSYLEFVMSTLDVPVFFVRGNHARMLEEGPAGPQPGPLGAVDLHRRVVRHDGVLLAGVEGSLRYKPGPFQYSQVGMWRHVLRLVPGLLWNRLRYGRFLDVFVSHAPPWRIHDLSDRAHRGARAFRWLLRAFQPTLHCHGHVHAYTPDMLAEVRLGRTRIVNAYGHRRIDLELPPDGPGRGVRER